MPEFVRIKFGDLLSNIETRIWDLFDGVPIPTEGSDLGQCLAIMHNVRMTVQEGGKPEETPWYIGGEEGVSEAITAVEAISAHCKGLGGSSTRVVSVAQLRRELINRRPVLVVSSIGFPVESIENPHGEPMWSRRTPGVNSVMLLTDWMDTPPGVEIFEDEEGTMHIPLSGAYRRPATGDGAWCCSGDLAIELVRNECEMYACPMPIPIPETPPEEAPPRKRRRRNE